MRQLNIKELIKFKRSTDRVKQNFALNLKINKEKKEPEDSNGGGDYWICATSAIENSFKNNDPQPIIDKKIELEEKYRAATAKKTKEMYERNLTILYSFEDVDSERWRPAPKMKFLSQLKENQNITVQGIQLQVKPKFVFEFEKDGKKEIGAIWFVAQLNGFGKDELGMFADILWRYLNTHFSKNHTINPQYCIAVDVYKGQDVSYLQPTENGVPMILNSTIDEIKRLM